MDCMRIVHGDELLGERHGRGWRADCEACRLPLAFHLCREGGCNVELFLSAMNQSQMELHPPLQPQLCWPCTLGLQGAAGSWAGWKLTLIVCRKTSSPTQPLCHCTGASVSAGVGDRKDGWSPELYQQGCVPAWEAPWKLLPPLSIQWAVQCQRGAQFSKATGFLINQIAGGFFLGPKGRWLKSPHPFCFLGNGHKLDWNQNHAGEWSSSR